MANFLIRSTPAVIKPPTIVPITLRVQSSVQGKPRQIGFGTSRIAGNLMWYGAYTSVPTSQTPAGGKGLGEAMAGVQILYPAAQAQAGGGTPTPPQEPANFASFAMFLGEGPVSFISRIWNNKSITTYSVASQPNAGGPGGTGNELGLTLFSGSYSQTAWPYLVSTFPTQADNYRGDAYVAAGPIYLGTTTELPNLSFEVAYQFAGALGQPDANPVSIIIDFLSNVHYGVGLPIERLNIASLGNYSTYCLASGTLLSPMVAEEHPALDYLREWAQATNSEYVWSGGQLTLIPFADTVVSGSGITYTPPAATPYSFTDADYMTPSEPVLVRTRRPEEQKNSIKIEFLDRNQEYNPAIYEAKDDALIAANGLNAAAVIKQYGINSIGVAIQCAQLLLGREQVMSTYTFTVPGKYILIDPMDIVTITDLNLGIQNLQVRVVEITELENYDLEIVCEDYPAGSATSPAYTGQAANGQLNEWNLDPGFVNLPFLWEPTDSLAGGLWIYGAISPQLLNAWGGCEIWASYDDVTYQRIGRIIGSSTVGSLTASLLAVSQALSGSTIDTTNTLSVSFAESGGSIASASQADVVGFNSLLIVGDEYIAYRDVTPTGTNTFNATYLNRGGFNTTVKNHSIGERVAKIDAGIFRFPYTADRIGATLYVKFLSFNKYGAGMKGLSDVGPFAYQIKGTALASALPSVTSFSAVYQPNVTEFTWVEISDFRQPILYELRKGTTFDGGAVLGRYAHPPVPALGDGTYWLNSFCQPAPGLNVYGAVPISLVAIGTVLSQNVKASWNEISPAPTGTFTGNITFDGTFIRTTSIQDFLSWPDVFAVADIYLSGLQGAGTYTISTAHEIDVGYVAPCLVAISASGNGVPINNNFFAYDPLFAVTDFFGSFANSLISVTSEIALSQDGTNYGPFFTYAAGTYNARKFKARITASSLDGTAIAFVTQFLFTVYIPTRVDHWAMINGVRTSLNNLVLPSAGATLTFMPDKQNTPAPFNGGVSSATAAQISGVILGAQPQDQLVITNAGLSNATVQCVNFGTGVATGVSRTVNLLVEGF